MSTLSESEPTQNVQSTVQQIFSEATQYPFEVLPPDADLEDDLGIDSVKLGEILSILRERFKLKEDLNLPAGEFSSIEKISQYVIKNIETEVEEETTENYITLNNDFNNTSSSENSVVILDALNEISGKMDNILTYLKDNGHNISDIVPKQSNTPISNKKIFEVDNVLQVFHEATQYPLEVLEMNADLEDDLGIDSVKLGEIFSLLRERFGLEEDSSVNISELATIGRITEYIKQKSV